ncbi:MAG: adenylate kinase [Acidobacteria bacterium]|nr:adenylate kinase [Acidobacteriota bacterium]
MALNLIMLGAPGAGKGTQAVRLARARRIPHVSTGAILREEVAADTAIGRIAREQMARGDLVDDGVMLGIVEERLSRPDAREGFVLDGFPRTVAQAEALDGFMVGRPPLIVVDIAAPEEELIRRLASRRICGACGRDATPLDGARGRAATRCSRCGGPIVQRTDDDVEVVRERLKVYQRQTAPLVEYYQDRPTFRAIDGMPAPEQVAAAIVRAVDDVQQQRAANSGDRP